MYLWEIIFVTDDAVLTIETVKIMFKPVFMKQFHFIKTLGYLFEPLKYAKRYVCEKGNIGTRKRVSTKSVSRFKNLQTTQAKNLPAVSHFNIKHFVLWTTRKTLEPRWRNRLKELRIRRAALKKNRINDINNNNNNNNGLLTVYPPSGSSPVENYNIKNEKL